MKRIKMVLYYLYDKLTGTFSGFVIGMAATGLVSRFFETKSFKNLWGLTAKKKVVDKETFGYLEWTASVVIGFLVFEIFTKVIKKKIDENAPRYKIKLKRWIIRKGWHEMLRNSHSMIRTRRLALFSSLYNGTKAAFSQFSKK